MGKLVEIKTKPTLLNVEDFINAIPDEQKRKDSHILLKVMEKAMKEKPKMWGSSIIGFGNYIAKSPATGREVEWLIIGFSPRKANISLYGLDLKRLTEDLNILGKHKTGVGCLYINKIEDIDIKVLEKMITQAAQPK